MITTLAMHTHPDLPGVSIISLEHAPLQRGMQQRVLVRMEAGTTIPLHRHTVDAIMDVVAGTGNVLSHDEENGREVTVGNRVLFAAAAPHGFVAGPEGMSFVSTNGGIVDEHGYWDMQLTN